MKMIIIAVIAGIVSGSAGTLFIAKAVKPKIELECNCEKCPESSKIDFDKIKGKHITIKNTQHIQVNTDSLFMQSLDQKLQELRVIRCK